MSKPTILMLHGAWHGPWFWENWIPMFEAVDYEVVAPQLPGSYGDFKQTKFADLVAAAQAEVDKLSEPPILIGHSLGGYVAQHLLSQQTYLAAVLVASIPGTGFPAKMMGKRASHPGRAVQAAIANDLNYFFPTARDLRNELFSADTPEEVVASCFKRLGHASMSLFVDAHLHRPRRPLAVTPALVLAAEGDPNISLAHQRKLAARLGAELQIIPSGHDIPLDVASEQAAQATIDWLGQL